MSTSEARAGGSGRVALTDEAVADFAAILGAAYARTLLGWWLIPRRQHRQHVLTRWAALRISDAPARTTVDSTGDRHACTVWRRWPGEPSPDWWRCLAEATSPYSTRFGLLHRALATAPRPGEEHRELLHAGVTPALQRSGRGSQLLHHRLQLLDGERHPAYTVAISPDAQRWLTRFRFLPNGPPIHVTDECPPLQPMWRTPSTETVRRTRSH